MSNCATALLQHAQVCTTLTVKNYQYMWEQFQSLCQSIANTTPNGHTQTYAVMATAPALGTTVASLSSVFARYNQACNAVFNQAVTTLDTMRIKPYIDLYNKYVAFCANSNVQTIDATLAVIPTSFPTVAVATVEQTSLKSNTQNIPYTDANVTSVNRLRIKYGEDLHQFLHEASVPTDGGFQQKLLQHIRKELAEFVTAFNKRRLETAETHRPSETGKQDIGIPPANTSTNAQDLIDVMNYYLGQSSALLTGGAKQAAAASIKNYIDLYDANYPAFLTNADIDLSGVPTMTHRTLRSNVTQPDTAVNDLSGTLLEEIDSRYKTARTHLVGLIWERLKALCREAYSVYLKIYDDFNFNQLINLTGVNTGNLGLVRRSDEFLNSWGPNGKTHDGIDRSNLENLKPHLASFQYPTSAKVPQNSAMRNLVNEIKKSLAIRVRAVENKLSIATNAALLSMPLAGPTVLLLEIAELATTIQTDLSDAQSIATKEANATDVGDTGLLGIAKKYFYTNGLNGKLEQELERLGLLKSARENAVRQLTMFYDICYLPFKYRLPVDYPLYDVTTFFPNTNQLSNNTSLCSVVTRPMSTKFNGQTVDKLQTLSTEFLGHVQTLVAKIKELVTDDLTQYMTLYNGYNTFASTYSVIFRGQTRTSNILNTIDLTAANWPASNPSYIAQNVTNKSVDTCADINTSLQSIRTLHRSHMERVTSPNPRDSHFFQLAKSIQEEFRLFLSQFQEVSKNVSNNTYTFPTISDVSISFEYNLYDPDSARLNLPTQESTTVLQNAYTLFMDDTRETVQSVVNLPMGMIPRYQTLISLFCIADDRRQGLSNMQQYWQKYRTLVDNLIVIPSDPLSGVQEIRGYFTGGQLNAAFEEKDQSFYEAITARFFNPDTLVGNTPTSGNHYEDAKKFTVERVRPLVERFMNGLLATYNKFRETDASMTNISDIFYKDSKALTEDEVCEGIYAFPPRYPRLLTFADYLNLKESLEKYKKCIPNDIRWRQSDNLLASKFA